MEQPENSPVAVATDEVGERSYTDRGSGTRETMNEAGAVGADRRPWVERALVPGLLGGIFSIAGWFAVHVSAQTRELRAEMGDVRSVLGEINGRLGGVDHQIDGLGQRIDGVDQRVNGVDQRIDGLGQRIDDLRRDMNQRFGRLEDRMGRIEALLMAQRPPPSSGS